MRLKMLQYDKTEMFSLRQIHYWLYLKSKDNYKYKNLMRATFPNFNFDSGSIVVYTSF